MLYAIDSINTDPDLLPGVELGYDIRDTCLSETIGLDEAIDLIITGSNLNLTSCDVVRDATGSSTNEANFGDRWGFWQQGVRPRGFARTTIYNATSQLRVHQPAVERPNEV